MEWNTTECSACEQRFLTVSAWDDRHEEVVRGELHVYHADCCPSCGQREAAGE